MIARRRQPDPRLSTAPAAEGSDPPGGSELGELFDVPATVVCARCGDVDCAGCDDALSRSGIVTILPWERSELPLLARLWSTARATTRERDAFFELLPDGPVAPALRFALLAEVLATLALFALFVPAALAVAPAWAWHLLADPAARGATARLLVVGVPGFAGMLVAAHAAHGYAIDVGARRSGSLPAGRRALRFGLYACGWDLVMGPFGAIAAWITEGRHAAMDVVALAAGGVPSRATKAFLRGAYGLDGDRAKHALRTSYLGAAIATLVGAFVVLAAAVVIFLA